MPTHNQLIQDQNNTLSPHGLREPGAYFAIEVHVPTQIANALTKQGDSIPTPVSGVGLIDTGVTITCIEETILTSGLQLNPIGVVNTGTANGPVQQNVYPGRIVFPQKGWTMDLGQVAGVNLAGQIVCEPVPKPIIALLGRNFWNVASLYTTGQWALGLFLSSLLSPMPYRSSICNSFRLKLIHYPASRSRGFNMTCGSSGSRFIAASTYLSASSSRRNSSATSHSAARAIARTYPAWVP